MEYIDKEKAHCFILQLRSDEVKSKEETKSTGRTVDGINLLLEMFPAMELGEDTLLLISASS